MEAVQKLKLQMNHLFIFKQQTQGMNNCIEKIFIKAIKQPHP